MLTAELGHRIYFTTAIDLARRMARAMAENRLSREIKNLTRPKLLIIDEVGYLALETAHASLLFQAICERYEKQQAIILTSNKAFADWGQVFAGDPIMASAALDRLLHRSTIMNIRGDSYRLKSSTSAATASSDGKHWWDTCHSKPLEPPANELPERITLVLTSKEPFGPPDSKHSL